MGEKIGALIRAMKFISPRLLFISTNVPYGFAWMWLHCCHVWAGAPSCYLEMLDKL